MRKQPVSPRVRPLKQMVGSVRLAAAAVSLTAALATAQPLSVVSLNLAKVTDAAAIERELREADVYLFQEVALARRGAASVAEEIAARRKLNVVYSQAKPGDMDLGLAILTRFPLSGKNVRLLKAYDLKFHSRTRFALSATVQTPSGPLRISNVHLDTRLNAEDRVQQLTPVVEDCIRFRMPRIIGGDFNSNDFYWLANLIPVPCVRSQVREIDAYMSRHGYRTPIPFGWPTFDHLGMHLDWIYGAGVQPRSAKVFPMRFSDHHAIWAQFVM
jgi:endonuclease/exonuclease/phosphatase family metal-dependent hydrolase